MWAVQVPTEKADVSEFGDPKEVAFTLADKVLTAPSQEIALLAASEVGRNGGGAGHVAVAPLAAGSDAPRAFCQPPALRKAVRVPL